MNARALAQVRPKCHHVEGQAAAPPPSRPARRRTRQAGAPLPDIARRWTLAAPAEHVADRRDQRPAGASRSSALAPVFGDPRSTPSTPRTPRRSTAHSWIDEQDGVPHGRIVNQRERSPAPSPRAAMLQAAGTSAGRGAIFDACAGSSRHILLSILAPPRHRRAAPSRATGSLVGISSAPHEHRPRRSATHGRGSTDCRRRHRARAQRSPLQARYRAVSAWEHVHDEKAKTVSSRCARGQRPRTGSAMLSLAGRLDMPSRRPVALVTPAAIFASSAALAGSSAVTSAARHAKRARSAPDWTTLAEMLVARLRGVGDLAFDVSIASGVARACTGPAERVCDRGMSGAAPARGDHRFVGVGFSPLDRIKPRY